MNGNENKGKYYLILYGVISHLFSILSITIFGFFKLFEINNSY